MSAALQTPKVSEPPEAPKTLESPESPEVPEAEDPPESLEVSEAVEEPGAPEPVTLDSGSTENETTPSPDTDENETTPSPDTDSDAIPVVPVGLTDSERFTLFRDWLENGGPRYEVWAKDCIFTDVRPPYLCLEFPSGFRANHVTATARDERLLKGVRAFFPNCTAVQVRDRNDESQRLTHRETVEHERLEAQKELEMMVAKNEDIVKIMDTFDAAIASVHSDYRSPVPPTLSGDEGI